MNYSETNKNLKKNGNKKFPKGKYFFGSVKVGERGQIVIPIKARKVFKINPGDQLLVFGEIKKGLGLMKASKLSKFITRIMPDFDLEGIDSEENLEEES